MKDSVVLKPVLALTIVLLFCLLKGEDAAARRVMWWNIENAFDCQHDSLKDDFDFLPEGAYRWTPSRYWHKLDNVARGIAAVAEGAEWPMLIGLAEVENDTVLRDLTQRSPLRNIKYRYVHAEGPDARGIDVALLYHPLLFTLIDYEAVRVPSAEHGLRPTRDVLHVRGIVGRSDTLHVVVAHLPSRAGDTRDADRNRRLAATTLCQVLQRLQGQRVIVMGDFNATPLDPLFRPIQQYVVSLMPQTRRELRKPEGTYFYQGLWSYIDHMLVSPSLLPQIEDHRAWAGRFPFLLTENGTPWRTFQGPIYRGGYSDHLPLYFTFSEWWRQP